MSRLLLAALGLMSLALQPAAAQFDLPITLLEPVGAESDYFGRCVCVSGETMVIGAPNDDVGANFDQGSASVYRRFGSAWVWQATLTASDGAAFDLFGFSVSVSGDTVVVGAAYDDIGADSGQGSVYVFTRSGSAWTQQSKLTVVGGAAADAFGTSVSVSGDTVVIGATGVDHDAGSNQGSAFIFTRSGSAWTQQANLIASDGAGFDYFGHSVAISGNTVVVGAFTDNVGVNTDQGSAYVFTRSGIVWTQQAKLVASDGAAGDTFGTSVSVSGDTVVVGASRDAVGANTLQGSAYVFTRSPNFRIWTQQAKLTASDGAANDIFGTSVSLSDDTIVIGAPSDDIEDNSDQGSAYVFVRSGNEWARQSKLVASDGATWDCFGNSVSVSNDTAVVGAYLDQVGDNVNEGSTYAHTRTGTVWTQQLRLTAADSAANNYFGNSVSISGDTAVVGAPYDNVRANAGQGSVHIYRRSGSAWVWEAALTASDGTAGDNLGMCVCVSGDTVIAGASGDDVGGITGKGSAYIFVRSGKVWTQQAKLATSISAGYDGFGGSVSLSGDAAAVGASGEDVNGNTNQGSAYLFTRSGSVWTQRPRLSAPDGSEGDSFGSSVSIFGDTLLVGAPLASVGANGLVGSAHVYRKSGSAWIWEAKLTASDGGFFDHFGNSVSISGDTVVIGAYLDDINGNNAQGSAYIFVHSGGAWAEQAKLTASVGAVFDNFGNSVSISGDTVVVGEVFDDEGASQERGSAYVFTRSGIAWTQEAKLSIADGEEEDFFGNSVSVSGDTVMIGVPGDSADAIHQGSARVFIRSAACPGDFNADSFVDDADFVLFIAAYNIFDCADSTMASGCPADLNRDGLVDDSDFSIFVIAYDALLCP